MLFGKSLFQSVVDRLASERPEVTEEERPQGKAVRGGGVAASFLAVAPEADEADEQRLYVDPYREALAAAPPATPKPTEVAEAPPPMPSHLKRLSEKEVREDLGLGPHDDAPRLAELRRNFARLNHPDRVPARYRAQATMRMMIANALIDDALLQIAPASTVLRRQS